MEDPALSSVIGESGSERDGRADWEHGTQVSADNQGSVRWQVRAEAIAVVVQHEGSTMDLSMRLRTRKLSFLTWRDFGMAVTLSASVISKVPMLERGVCRAHTVVELVNCLLLSIRLRSTMSIRSNLLST